MDKPNWLASGLFCLCLGSFCTSGHADNFDPAENVFTERQIGTASYYSDRFNGRRTASGERYDRNDLTAVHSWLPFGTIIRVTNLRNHHSVDLRINDRKNPHNHRLLDVSRRAARELGFIGSGLARVEIEVVRYGDS